MTTWGQGWEIFDPLFAVHDIGGYNYQLHEVPSDHERVPSRIIVQTESYRCIRQLELDTKQQIYYWRFCMDRYRLSWRIWNRTLLLPRRNRRRTLR